MADVYGRLTGRAGVCMATLGPGATNLITGFADANMDRAPIVAIAGQGATTRLHKESHQILNLVNLFQPIAKYATQILEPEIVPEIVRKAFKVAQTEKPGGAFIEFPENIAEASVLGSPIEVQTAYNSAAPDFKIEQAAKIISDAKFPVILAGNGVIRQGAAEELVRFAEMLRIPVANSFMAKGIVPFSSDFSLGTIGLKASFANADRHLWPGAYVRVALSAGTTKNAVVLPPQAVLEGPDGNFVFQVDADKHVVSQPVTLLRIQDHNAVVDGLRSGETVVVEGARSLRSGMTVAVDNAAAAGTAVSGAQQ